MANVQSILNKLCDFKLFLDSCNPDLIILTETWLSSSIPTSLFAQCHDHYVCRHDRLSRGGGVCVLIKKLCGRPISVNRVELAEASQDLEIVAVDIAESNAALPLRLIAVLISKTEHQFNTLV